MGKSAKKSSKKGSCPPKLRRATRAARRRRSRTTTHRQKHMSTVKRCKYRLNGRLSARSADNTVQNNTGQPSATTRPRPRAMGQPQRERSRLKDHRGFLYLWTMRPVPDFFRLQVVSRINTQHCPPTCQNKARSKQQLYDY
jgi:hypothetical protein